MASRTKIAVLITAYNEESNIGEVIDQIDGIYDIYVVNDGSTDRTGEVSREKGAEVIDLPLNLGQGAASIAGYKLINDLDYDYLVKMDGDGQHDPGEIPGLLDAVKNPGVDLVVGSRVLGTNYEQAPRTRSTLLVPLTRVLNFFSGYDITDSMSGFKAYSGDFLPRFVEILDDTLEPRYMATELWLRLARLNTTVKEVPINMRERRAGSSHKGSALLSYGLGILKTFVRTKLDTMRESDTNEY